MWERLKGWFSRLFNSTANPKEVILSPSDLKLQREEEVRAVIEEIFPPGEPYIYQGKFSWFSLLPGDPIRPISFFFLELPLCIQVHGPGVTVRKSSTVEAITESSPDQVAAEFLRDVCKEYGYGLLEIYSDALVSKEIIKRYLIQMNLINA